MYFVLNLDVKTSRTSKDRIKLQGKLKALCLLLNKEDNVVSKFDIILGDEIQGLLEANDQLFKQLELIHDFENKHEIAFYKGIGYGSVETSLDAIHVEKNDGPAFHHAREAVNDSKKKGKPDLHFNNQDFLPIQHLVNLRFRLLEALSIHGRLIYEAIIKGDSQVEISKKLDIKQSSISRSSSRAYLQEIIHLKSCISNYMNLILKE